jgi:hypothetical protein
MTLADKLLELYMPGAVGTMRPILKAMPKRKRLHSIRVASAVNNTHDDHVWAALVHDYLERGGKLRKLAKHAAEMGLSDRVIRIAQALQIDKNEGDNAVLDHLQRVIPLLIKLSDRIDNLRKRLFRYGRVGKNYWRKSDEILQYLRSVYDGPQEWWVSLERDIVAIGDAALHR